MDVVDEGAGDSKHAAERACKAINPVRDLCASLRKDKHTTQCLRQWLSTAWHPGITIIVKTIRPYAVTTFRIDEIETALEKLWMERKIDLDICA